jgi:hypothetical protein
MDGNGKQVRGTDENKRDGWKGRGKGIDGNGWEWLEMEGN